MKTFNLRTLRLRPGEEYRDEIVPVRVPDDPVKRFPAVVKAADVLLAVTREAA